MLEIFCPTSSNLAYDTQAEIILSQNVTTYISTLFANYGYTTYSSQDATVSTYREVLNTLRIAFDNSVFFSKGHRGIPYGTPPWNNYNHRSLIDHNGNNVIDHLDIYPYTSSENAVTFIWHCETALFYPAGATSDSLGYYGLPYCFTHNPNMQEYTDTTGSQVYLGWSNAVPAPPYPLPGGSPQYNFTVVNGYNYGNVAAYFWYFMCQGQKVNVALNSLCDLIYDRDFSGTNLHGWLVVYGNGEMTLP